MKEGKSMTASSKKWSLLKMYFIVFA